MVKWTKESPTEPGFYFIRYPKRKITRVVWVGFGKAGEIRPDLLRAYNATYTERPGGNVICDIATPLLWAGPIPLPEGENHEANHLP